VTDDREAGTLLGEGHINSVVRKAVAHGLSPADAVKLASLNPARYHGLERLGAVAPGYIADLQVVPDLESFEPEAVFKAGRLVAENGGALPFESPPVRELVRDTVRVAAVGPKEFRIPAGGFRSVRVVELVPDQVITRAATCTPRVEDAEIVADPDADLAKLAVVERHHASGAVGLGLVRGFGLRAGAFASSVAHDAHNIVIAGVDDADMALCVQRLAALGGGLVVCRGGQVLGELPLEIAGLMSVAPASEVAAGIDRLESLLGTLGVTIDTPFMYLSFLALSVIPELRVTDQGIVDVRSFELVPLGLS
jgi:adenine deaminase